MGLFSRRKTEDRANASSLYSAGPRDTLTRVTSWPTYGADLTVPEMVPPAAMAIADVWSCCRILAESAASLPLIAYRTAPDGTRQRFSGRLADLLQRPSPNNSAATLISTLMAHLNLWGNCYIGKFRDAAGNVTQIAPIDPWRVAVRLIQGEPHYQYYALEGVEELTTADLVHIRGMSTDGIIGLSPITQCSRALGLASSLEDFATNFAANAGRPGGILRLGGWRGRAEGGTTRSDWDAEFGTAANAGKLLIVGGDGDMQYQQFALSMEDAQFVAQRQLSTAEVCRIFRVPPWMVGGHVERGLTYSNAEMQAQAFLKFTLQPWLVLIEQAITNDPDLSPSTVYVQFLVDAMLRGDSATRAAYYAAALDPVKGWMTREEVRELENLSTEGAQPEQGANPP